MVTLAAILERFGDAYSRRYRWTPQQAKVAGRIRACRTPALPACHTACQQCGEPMVIYGACRNRHCPHCQQHATEAWLQKQRTSLLPVGYFHLVFTLPHTVNTWVQLHPEVIYRCLFQSAWATLKEFGQDPKRLNGELGVTAVLHTWGQTLERHVHLHCLVPAGAWSESEQQWHPARSNYLFPVKALSRCFRGKMVSALRHAAQDNALHRIEPQQCDRQLDQLMQSPWVVYTKACHSAPGVLEYLSRYTHRIAISEARLLAIKDQSVVLRWKDYRDDRQKIMQLDGVEFLRRFLLHVLPAGFMRIRHYGFLSNRLRRQRISAIQSALHAAPVHQRKLAEPVKSYWAPLICDRCRLRWAVALISQQPEIRQRE